MQKKSNKKDLKTSVQRNNENTPGLKDSVDISQMILDGDFSKVSKPSNQVPLADYMKYMEQYFRPITETDLNLLRDPVDDFSPYAFPTPPAQANYYLQMWALEDKEMVALCDNFQYPSSYKRPHNFVELENGDIGQGEVDLGPLTSRVLQSLVETSVLQVPPGLLEPDVSLEDDYDLSMNSAESIPMEIDEALGDDDAKMAKKKAKLTKKHSRQNSFSSAGSERKKPYRGTRTGGAFEPRYAGDMDILEERIKRELHVVGILSDKDLNASLSDKDELGHELRSLQSALHTVAERNSELRRRLLDVATGYKAMEEYEQVYDELRDQIKASYQRKYAKSKKNRLKKQQLIQSSTAQGSAGDIAEASPTVQAGNNSADDLSAANGDLEDRPIVHPGSANVSANMSQSLVGEELLQKIARYEQVVKDVGRFFTVARFPFDPPESIFNSNQKPESCFSNLRKTSPV